MGVYIIILRWTVYIIVSWSGTTVNRFAWVLLTCSFWVSENINLAIVSNVLTSKGSAGGNGTMWTVRPLHSAIICVLVISLVLIMYHWCVSGVTCRLF